MNMDHDDNAPDIPEPVVLDQTVNDVVEPHAAAFFPDNLTNTGQISQITDDGARKFVVNNDGYPNVPIIDKKVSKKEDDGVWSPSFSGTELGFNMNKLNLNIGIDPEYRKMYSDVGKAQTLENSEKLLERTKDNNIIENNEEPGSRVCGNDNDDLNLDDQEQLNEDNNADTFQTYQKYDLNKSEIINEQFEMRKRVQNWHDKLKPVLEAEEKRNEFNEHEYGKRVLECFDEIGEKKSFKELVGGLEPEEVSRNFVSILMMTNSGNVKIINPQHPDEDMKIEILKK